MPINIPEGLTVQEHLKSIGLTVTFIGFVVAVAA